jgi:hypothetical protein
VSPRGLKKGQKIRSKLDGIEGEIFRITAPFTEDIVTKIDEIVVELSADRVRQYMEQRRKKTKRVAGATDRIRPPSPSRILRGTRADVVRLLVHEALEARAKSVPSTQPHDEAAASS